MGLFNSKEKYYWERRLGDPCDNFLILTESDIKRGDLEIIFECLKTNKTLTEIIFESIRINDIGVFALSEALKINITLRHLTLNGAGIDCSKARYLAGLLTETKTLEEIDLSDNFIKDAGVKHLSDALYINRSLETLILNDNMIQLNGIRYLSEALRMNNTLTCLDISKNTFDYRVLLCIGSMVNNTRTLRSLNIGKIGINCVSCVILTCALERNYSITDINLLCNSDIWRDEAELEIKKELEENISGRKKQRFENGKLLLHCYHFENESFFYKENIPLDIFKIIFRISGCWYRFYNKYL